jgi:hypothetical protein
VKNAPLKNFSPPGIFFSSEESSGEKLSGEELSGKECSANQNFGSRNFDELFLWDSCHKFFVFNVFLMHARNFKQANNLHASEKLVCNF